MSHSESDPERGWDRGLFDNDFVALTLCRRVGEQPIDWQANSMVQYVRVKHMREAWSGGLVTKEKPKGAQEGFELRVTWPSAIASSSAKAMEVTENRLKLKRESDGRILSLSLQRGKIKLEALVTVGQVVLESQIVGSVVPVVRSLPNLPKASKKTYLDWLCSNDIAARYAAAKALAYFSGSKVQAALTDTLQDTAEHIYIRLEAAASLARLGLKSGWEGIEKSLNSEYLENQLEAVIILGELRSGEAVALLIKTLLDVTRHAEIRAGAAWAIGEVGHAEGVDALVRTFSDLTPGLRVEAVRALKKLSDSGCPNLAPLLHEASSEKRAGLAWALGRSGRFSVDELVSLCGSDDEARRWVAYIIGMQQEADTWAARLQPIKDSDPEVFFAATVLWQIMRSWIADVDEF